MLHLLLQPSISEPTPLSIALQKGDRLSSEVGSDSSKPSVDFLLYKISYSDAVSPEMDLVVTLGVVKKSVTPHCLGSTARRIWDPQLCKEETNKLNGILPWTRIQKEFTFGFSATTAPNDRGTRW